MAQRFSKSVLSQYLRTTCDKQLFLSLYTASDLAKEGLPTPIKARPQLEIFKKEGRDWEQEKYEEILKAFPKNAAFRVDKGDVKDQSLQEVLTAKLQAPCFILEGEFGHSTLKDRVLNALGATAAVAGKVPQFEQFRPDIVLVRQASDAQLMVLPNATLASISDAEARYALQVVDIKSAGEANTSYASEVTLYAVVLASWLELTGLSNRYFVSADVALWTRSRERSSVMKVLEDNPGAPLVDLLKSFLEDLELIPILQFLPSVAEFLSSKLPSIAGTADWASLDWHVDNRCAACDWLAYEPWLTPALQDQAKKSEHYCFRRAEVSGHLSRVAFLSRGARRTLQGQSVASVDALSKLAPTAPELREHNALRADARFLPTRASVLKGTPQIDSNVVRPDLPEWVELEIFVAVNFDPGRRLITGLGLYAMLRPHKPYGHTAALPEPTKFPAFSLVTVDPNDSEEQQTLIAFLNRLAEIFKAAYIDQAKGGPFAAKNRTQIYFWDARQYEELCACLGRHLGAILDDDSLRGLAWLFPPEEVAEKPEYAEVPPIAIIKPVLKKAVAVPLPHVYTLFGIVEHYNSFKMDFLPTSYFRDPLSDMIPRERIYEVWARSVTPRDWQSVLNDYRNAIKSQVTALANITWRVKKDLKKVGQAPVVSMNGLVNYQMSPDGRLWYLWALLEDAVNQTGLRIEHAGDPQEQEAKYQTLRFSKLLARQGETLKFQISEDSIHCKFSDGEGFLALRDESRPGFLGMAVRQLGGDLGSDYAGDIFKAGRHKLSRIFGAELVSIDRDARQAVVKPTEFSVFKSIRDYLESHGRFSYAEGSWSLVEGATVPDAESVKKCLQAIGNPAIATPHPASLTAYGTKAKSKVGNSAPTPVAEILWIADKLVATVNSLPTADIDALMTILAKASLKLNASQKDALIHALERKLSIIWGPPGTGKTSVVVVLIVALVWLAGKNKTPKRILITGPTYKALKEILDRLIPALEKSISAPVLIARVFSPSGGIHNDTPPISGPHLKVVSCTPDANPEYQKLMTELQSPTAISLVFALPRQCFRMTTGDDGTPIREFFDVCVMDECSQVKVTQAMLALGLLANGGQAVLLGDHRQMPPIFAMDPPVGAEFMVGSIQTYLLERFRGAIEAQPLLTNYRSSQPFVDFAKTLGYPRNLAAHSPALRLSFVSSQKLVQPTNWPAEVKWDSWIEKVLRADASLIAVVYEDGLSGQFNDFEAGLAAGIVATLKENAQVQLANELDINGAVLQTSADVFDEVGFWGSGVGIVTPHRAQRVAIVERIRKLYPATKKELIEEAVDTVERFQGGQRDTIVVSFGVGDPDLIEDEEAFLLQLERMNVAISRARAKCIVLISRELAYHLPEDKEVIRTSKAVKSFTFECCPQISEEAVTFNGNVRTISIRSNC